jgi:acyl carrier protein
MKKTFILKEIAKILELDDEGVTGAERLSALSSWDSLAVLGFIAFADQNFNVVLSVADIHKSQTVNDLMGLLGKNVE